MTTAHPRHLVVQREDSMTTTTYPRELAGALAQKLADELRDENVIAVSTAVEHVLGTDTYTLTMTYRRRGGSSC